MLLRLEALVEKQTAVIEQQQQTIASLKTELNRANTRITELERIVGPNSSNSSLPPSADGVDLILTGGFQQDQGVA
jgi:predicted RNase H-like nuclease (RuvC/YqgF family)